MEAINPCKTELYPGSITLTLTIKNCVSINEEWFLVCVCVCELFLSKIQVVVIIEIEMTYCQNHPDLSLYFAGIIYLLLRKKGRL
jgi:hypothetical protein